MEKMTRKEFEKIISKYKDIISIVFAETSPRATICHIILKQYPYERNIHEEWIHSHAYGVAIRKKSDMEDIELAKSLALKRAIKQYKKIRKEQHETT